MSKIVETKEKTLDDIRKYFVNPEDPKTAEDLALLGANAIRVMALIYANGGEIDRMPQQVRDWLNNSRDNDGLLEGVVGSLLKAESKTRRFDNRFMGQIHPQGNKVGILGNLIAAYMNNNLIVSEVSQSEQEMERYSIKWLAETLGYDPETASGNITSGGTTANLAALEVARNKVLKEIGMKNPLRRIRADLPPIYVLASKWRHYSIDKACDTLGIGLLTLPSEDFKINPKAVEKAVIKLRERGNKVAAIVGLAGETETGMVEDLESLATIAKEYDVFFHVDGAYGASFMLSRAQTEKRLFDGIQLSDSVTIDPHKLLYTPYSAGAVIFKDKSDHNLLQTDTRYLGVVASTIEGSRGSGGVISTYATIKLFGRDGLKALMDHTLDLAEFAYQIVGSSELLTPIHKPELNTMLIKINDKLKAVARSSGFSENDIETAIVDAQKELDHMGYQDPYLSRNGKVDKDVQTGFEYSAYRYIGMHPYTTTEDVRLAVNKLEEILKEKFRINDKA